MATKNFSFPFRDYQFHITKFTSEKITKYDVLLACQEIYKEANYFRNLSLNKNLEDSLSYTFIVMEIYSFILFLILVIMGDWPWWLIYLQTFFNGWICVALLYMLIFWICNCFDEEIKQPQRIIERIKEKIVLINKFYFYKKGARLSIKTKKAWPYYVSLDLNTDFKINK